MEWEVWLADGTTRSSQTCTWADVPDGIVAVRIYGSQKWVNYGDGVYGEPGTWKNAALVSDEDFARVLTEARDPHRLPPSERP